MKKSFYTAHITYPGGIWITAATNHSFAPYWSDVEKFREKEITEEEYTKKYLKKLREEMNRHKNIFYDFPDNQIFKCYCKKNDFCHRFLLAKFLEDLGHEYLGELSL